jgi:hypothetical protein
MGNGWVSLVEKQLSSNAADIASTALVVCNDALYPDK